MARSTAKKASVSRTTPAGATTRATGQTSPAKKSASKQAVGKTATKKTATKNTATKRSTQRGTSVATKKAAAAASATATKATASALAVREGEEAWTKDELDEVLGELREQREHSLQVLTVQEAELNGLMRDSGDGAGQDQADMGATSFERDHELTVLNSERDKLAQIERALIAISEGTYGICESCGQPIGKMRLMAFPRATLCMTCKQREERR
jgi:DnaK suppressor protein